MPWTLKIERKVKKDFKKIPSKFHTKILKFLETILDNPKNKGKSLTGNLSGYWRYRVGDYRIICELQDQVLIVLVVKIGHRKNIYD